MVVELGEILNGAAEGRTGDAQITDGDLNGITAQDSAIASIFLDAA